MQDSALFSTPAGQLRNTIEKDFFSCIKFKNFEKTIIIQKNRKSGDLFSFSICSKV
jgi:hypothetical protein